MNFSELLERRYSCKNFSDRRIEEEKLAAILEAGRMAPTAKNLQEQRIYVLQTEESLKIIDEATPCRYNALTVLVVAYNADTVFTYPGGKRDSGAEDAAIVATHMLLSAASEGVDSCWINNFDPERLEQAMRLPGNEKILMLLDLGYAAEGVGPLPNHGKRKPITETVEYR